MTGVRVLTDLSQGCNGPALQATKLCTAPGRKAACTDPLDPSSLVSHRAGCRSTRHRQGCCQSCCRQVQLLPHLHNATLELLSVIHRASTMPCFVEIHGHPPWKTLSLLKASKPGLAMPCRPCLGDHVKTGVEVDGELGSPASWACNGREI